MLDTAGTPRFKFNDPNGWIFCREILKKYLPFTPHDYQLEGVAEALDGNDVMAITATGSGKSAYIYMLVMILQELGRNHPQISTGRHFPQDPVVVVISPTTALEEDQERTMSEFGLTAKAVNATTKADAAAKGQNIWDVVAHDIAVIFVSPEMLATRGFEGLLQRKTFQNRVYALITDEVHLLCRWGGSFRPQFEQIGFMRARFPDTTVFIGMTATLRDGQPMKIICQLLGLQDGKFHLIRRSNARHDVQFIIRVLRANQSSERFPQLDWVLREKGKVLIFCSSIRSGFNLAVHLWHVDPKSAVLHQTIRLFNSLNETEYNTETFDLLRGSSSSKVTIATDKLSVGINVPDFETVVIIDPKDPDDLVQKGGRVGRDRTKVQNPRIVVYISSALMSRARELEVVQLDSAFEPLRKSAGKRGVTHAVEDTMDPSLARIITANCIPSAIDLEYSNPPTDKPCSSHCTTCAQNPPLQPRDPCDCSGCIPEDDGEGSVVREKTRKKLLPLNIRLTKKMKEVGAERLRVFRRELWKRADEAASGMIPINAYLPESIISTLLDNMETLLTKESLICLSADPSTLPQIASAVLHPFISKNPQISNSATDLIYVLLELHETFDSMRSQSKLDAQTKRMQTKQVVADARGGDDIGDDNSDH